jgi:glycogen synthase
MEIINMKPFTKTQFDVIHVGAEGVWVEEGGNGKYVSFLSNLQTTRQKKSVAMITPFYVNQSSKNEGFTSYVYKDKIRDEKGIYKDVNITVWHKKENGVDVFALEPDENHKNYFTVDDNDDHLGSIKSVPKLARKKGVNLKKRFNHFDELSASFINYLSSQGCKTKLIHSHNYGNISLYLDNSHPLVNTYHGFSGEGKLPDYLEKDYLDSKGSPYTPRALGFLKNHHVYAVSKKALQFLHTTKKYSEATLKVSSQRIKEDRISAVANIPNTGEHNFDNFFKTIAKEEKILRNLHIDQHKIDKLTVSEKKLLAKQIFSLMLEKYLNENIKFDPSRKTVLYLSRICNDKGSRLLESVINYCEKNDMNIVIVGRTVPNDKYSAPLLKRLKDKFPNLPFIINEAQEKFNGLFRYAADIGVGTSYDEAYGLIYAEGTRYGIHYIASNVGGTKEALIKADNGSNVDENCSTLFDISYHKGSEGVDLDSTMINLTKAFDKASQLVNNSTNLSDDIVKKSDSFYSLDAWLKKIDRCYKSAIMTHKKETRRLSKLSEFSDTHYALFKSKGALINHSSENNNTLTLK